jgi:hypothetical protein
MTARAALALAITLALLLDPVASRRVAALTAPPTVTEGHQQPGPASPEPSFDGRRLSEWEALLTHEDPRYRARAVTAYGALGARGLPVFLWALGDDDPTVRIAAVRRIGLLGHLATEAVPALAQLLLTDPIRGVQMQALHALGEIGPSATQAVPALRFILQHGDLALRVNAAMALQRITGETR